MPVLDVAGLFFPQSHINAACIAVIERVHAPPSRHLVLNEHDTTIVVESSRHDGDATLVFHHSNERRGFVRITCTGNEHVADTLFLAVLSELAA